MRINKIKTYRIKTLCYILGLILIFSFISLMVTSVSDGETVKTLAHPNMYINNNEIESIKNNIMSGKQPWISAYDDMIKEANNSLSTPIQSVTFGGKTPPSGDKHDYWTEEPYVTDGVVDPDADRTDYNYAIKVGKSVRVLGLAYAFTGDSRYADKAIELINGWTVDPSTRMNPKFTNGQSKIEISMSIPGMFYGADLIWNYPGWNQPDKDAFKSWTTEMIGSAKSWSRDNNFENWRLAFISTASVVAEDDSSRQYAFNRWKEIIYDQMNSDGSLKQELSRTNSLTYSTFALNAMVQTAEIARHYGTDLYSYKLPDGSERGLEKSLDFHAYYIVNPSDWTYQQKNDYDGANAAIYELAYSYKQKPSYRDVIVKWGRPMYEMRIMGPTTLTHADTNLGVTGSVNTGSTNTGVGTALNKLLVTCYKKVKKAINGQ